MASDTAERAAAGRGPAFRLGPELGFIRFSHTVFAMPFALASLLLASGGWPDGGTLVLVLVCLVCARTSAMAFNRWVDWDFDRKNPRTAGRHTMVSKTVAWWMIWVPLAGFAAGAAMLNPLCAVLAPVAVALVFGYSLMKRFTAWSHAFLGLALAAAPMGAWAAARGTLADLPPWLMAGAVWLWVFGFDLIYATQDTGFDRSAGLHSFPARYGDAAAVRLASALHVGAWGMLAAFGWAAGFSGAYWVGWALVGPALAFEHALARTGDVKRINHAFFEVNAAVSLIIMVSVATELWTR